VRKLVDEQNDDVEISLSDTKIDFAIDGVALTSKLIDGTFPDYTRVIPSGNDKAMEIACKEFSEAVDRVSTISSEKSRAIKLSVNGNTLTLSASGSDNDTAVEEIEVSYNDVPLEIGFNSRYLLDITQQIEGDYTELLLADSTAPTVIRDTSDASALYVLMPMRV
jgi:DNA polymerase-3 subunit beta